MSKSIISYWVVFLSQIIALMLVMLPLPAWAQAFRPDWVALVLIYWCMIFPTKVGIGLAFVFGLLLDVTLGTLLGQHAIGMVLIAAIVLKLYQRIRVYPLGQQSIIIFLLLIIKQLSVLWPSGIIGQTPDNIFLYFAPSFIGMLIWHWVFFFMSNVTRRFSQT